MEQNKLSWWIKSKNKLKNNVSYQIISLLLVYWILGNIILLSLFTVFTSPWSVISGFNLGFVGSLIGFLTLVLASKWFVSSIAFKQTLAYFTFLFRMLVYAAIIALAFSFNFANLIGVIVGFSLLMIATLSSECFSFTKAKKEKKECF